MKYHVKMETREQESQTDHARLVENELQRSTSKTP